MLATSVTLRTVATPRLQCPHKVPRPVARNDWQTHCSDWDPGVLMYQATSAEQHQFSYWVHSSMQAWEVWQAHGEWVRSHDPKFGPGIKDRFDMASRVTHQVGGGRECDTQGTLLSVLNDCLPSRGSPTIRMPWLWSCMHPC
jgi:amidase